MTELAVLPREIGAKPKAYAFARSIGMAPAAACRKAGGKVENGHATKWERSPRVQAWISHFRSVGQTEEMIAAKRALIEERLEMAAFGNIFDFSVIDETTNTPTIDWRKVADSPYGVIIAGFKFDKETGRLADFERDNALQALAQLRDMHGFKAVTKNELTGPQGGPLQNVIYAVGDKPPTAEQWAAEHVTKD